MALVGRIALALALAVALYGIGASVYGARRGRRDWVDSGRRAVYALAAILTVAMAILEVAFISNDFAYNTVAETSSTTTPLLYRMSALWSSQEGSLLLWVWLLSIWSSVAIYITRNRLRDVVPYATSVLLGFGAFFTTPAGVLRLAVRADQPGAREGAGLDPLLRNPSMLIHPPMLYSGYTFFTIPFAFAVGALIVRRVDADWIRVTRRFALASWLFLGIGVLLGARWSYYELELGRLLGLGSGRERRADAVADQHRVPALGDDPGEARDAEDLERVARARRGHARDRRHLPRALGDPELDPRLRRLDARDPVRDPDRGDGRRLGLSRREPPRGAAQRAHARLAALTRGGLPAQQHRAGRRSASSSSGAPSSR